MRTLKDLKKVSLEKIEDKIQELEIYSTVAKSCWLLPNNNVEDVEVYYNQVKVVLDELINLIEEHNKAE